MGWTHEQFEAQPVEILAALRTKMTIFARVENERQKKAGAAG